MADIIKNDEIPVFLINGFLDAGKTSFIAYTIGEDYFHIDGNTLLIVGESVFAGENSVLIPLVFDDVGRVGSDCDGAGFEVELHLLALDGGLEADY